MGKLHSLRRAIERDPQRWLYGDGRWVCGARKDRKGGGWQAVNYVSNGSYHNFVKKVLLGLAAQGKVGMWQRAPLDITLRDEAISWYKSHR